MLKKILVLIILLSNLKICWAIQFEHKLNPYATHQPVLYTMAINTTGPIIEFGCGNGSTSLLHEICKQNQRLLISVDDNLEWLNKFREKYRGDGYEPDNSGWHKFYYVPGKPNIPYDAKAEHWIRFLDNFELLQTISFELCFIDQDPFQARIETILRLQNKAKYIILHDCDYFSDFLGKTIQPLNPNNQTPGIYDFSKTFNYFKVYFPLRPWPFRTGPPTLLGSNYVSNLPEINYANY